MNSKPTKGIVKAVAPQVANIAAQQVKNTSCNRQFVTLRNRGDACIRGVVWSEGWIHDSHQVGCVDTDVTRQV